MKIDGTFEELFAYPNNPELQEIFLDIQRNVYGFCYQNYLEALEAGIEEIEAITLLPMFRHIPQYLKEDDE